MGVSQDRKYYRMPRPVSRETLKTPAVARYGQPAGEERRGERVRVR
jgi:hypothetical protein